MLHRPPCCSHHRAAAASSPRHMKREHAAAHHGIGGRLGVAYCVSAGVRVAFQPVGLQ